MLSVFLGFVLLATLFGSPALLLWRGSRMRWFQRYFLSLLPISYTALGWWLGTWAYGFFDCQGNTKNIHGCYAGSVEITALVGHGLFLAIPAMFVAGPLSLWFGLDTAIRHLGSMDKRG